MEERIGEVFAGTELLTVIGRHLHAGDAAPDFRLDYLDLADLVVRTICLALIAIGSICGSAGCNGMAAAPAQRSIDPAAVATITIAGESTVRRSPDVAFVVVTVQTTAQSSKDARQKNAVTMSGLHKRLEENHIPADAIRTVMYDLRREFDYVKGRQVPRQFVAQNTVDTLFLVDSRTRWKALPASDRCKNIGMPPVALAVLD